MGLETVVVEFEKVTKYPLIAFMGKYRDFMLNSYNEVNLYYSGISESIDNSHLTALKELTEECENVYAQFKNFANKFSTCGYWELMDYIDDLNNAIEKINKLPKFRRTALSKRGYQPYILVSSTVGGYRTLEDVADSIKAINNDNSNWVDLALTNDLSEDDWEIDKLSPLTALINNKIDIVVTTILDQPIGKRIYGKDIFRKISFEDNDLKIVEYQNNVEQKCDILLEVNKGDVPENMTFGKSTSLITGITIKSFALPEVLSEIVNNFMQNDLFENVEVTDYSYEESTIKINVNIKTKYDYKTEKKVVI